MTRPARQRHTSEQGQPAPRRQHNRNEPAVRVGPPRTVPITPEQHQQAVRALAAMIESWWRSRHDHHPDTPPSGT